MRRLVVTYDVTGMTRDEAHALAFEAVVQSETSDTHPGTRTVPTTEFDPPLEPEVIVFWNTASPSGEQHKQYLMHGKEGWWYAQSESGISEALANFTPTGTTLQIALKRSQSPEEALAVFKQHAYRQYAESAEILA